MNATTVHEWPPERTAMNRRQQLAAAVRRARIARQLTQAQLAERVGVHHQTIGNLERGTVDVSPDVLTRVEQELGIKLNAHRLANQAAVQVIVETLERRLAEIGESDGLVLCGEMLRYIASWQGPIERDGTGAALVPRVDN